MNKNNRPVIIPTALSSGTLLWSIVFVLYFLAAAAAYSAWCRLSAAEERLKEPSVTHVEAELFHCTLPKSAVRYSLEGNRLTIYFHETNPVPVIVVSACRDPAIAYRALDINPMLGTLNVREELTDLGYSFSGITDSPVVIGSDFVHIKPGLRAARSCFRFYYNIGMTYCFASGDCSYSVLMFRKDSDQYTDEELDGKLMKLIDGLELVSGQDRIVRPNVNSAEFTTEYHERVHAEADRERVLWRMFADRVATEPETALVSAIGHFRKYVELMASVLEEREILRSDDFRKYEKLIEQRERIVREWFVLLDKHLAMGDNEAARRQVDFIQRHATLLEESLDRRRAAAIGAKLAAREAKANGR